MRRIKSLHPLHGTVSRLFTWQEQRDLRQMGLWGKGGKQNPKVKRGAFVKFMNRIENRGPQGPFSLHEKWTDAIKTNMEEDSVWPEGDADWDIEILARYLQELQRQFWNSLYPLLKQELLPIHCEACGWQLISPARELLVRHRVHPNEREGIIENVKKSINAYNRIYDMIRRKGIRDKLFIMTHGGSLNIRYVRIFLDNYPHDEWVKRRVWHNEHGTITSSFKGKAVPFLIMPHKRARVDVYSGSQERKLRYKFEYLQPGEDVFVF